jgi:uncharacterized membrane protein
MWTTIALAAVIFAALYAVKTGAKLLNPAVAVGILSFICAMYMGWAILPNATKRIANRYAELAWMDFLQLSQERSAPVSKS